MGHDKHMARGGGDSAPERLMEDTCSEVMQKGRAGEVKETEHLTPEPEEAEGWRGRWQCSCQGDLSAGS